MIAVIALAKEDGWAFVRTSQMTHLVRPPYIARLMSIVDQQTVDKAIAEHGFVRVDQSFQDWKTLIEFLNQEVANFRDAQEQKLNADKIPSQLLEIAPENILSSFLDRVEQELLPKREWDHATNLLMAMLKTPNIRQNPELGNRATCLLEKTQYAQKQEAKAKAMLAEESDCSDVLIGRAINRYGKDALHSYIERIQQQGQIFNFAR